MPHRFLRIARSLLRSSTSQSWEQAVAANMHEVATFVEAMQEKFATGRVYRDYDKALHANAQRLLLAYRFSMVPFVESTMVESTMGVRHGHARFFTQYWIAIESSDGRLSQRQLSWSFVSGLKHDDAVDPKVKYAARIILLGAINGIRGSKINGHDMTTAHQSDPLRRGTSRVPTQYMRGVADVDDASKYVTSHAPYGSDLLKEARDPYHAVAIRILWEFLTRTNEGKGVTPEQCFNVFDEYVRAIPQPVPIFEDRSMSSVQAAIPSKKKAGKRSVPGGGMYGASAAWAKQKVQEATSLQWKERIAHAESTQNSSNHREALAEVLTEANQWAPLIRRARTILAAINLDKTMQDMVTGLAKHYKDPLARGEGSSSAGAPGKHHAYTIPEIVSGSVKRMDDDRLRTYLNENAIRNSQFLLSAADITQQSAALHTEAPDIPEEEAVDLHTYTGEQVWRFLSSDQRRRVLSLLHNRRGDISLSFSHLTDAEVKQYHATHPVHSATPELALQIPLTSANDIRLTGSERRVSLRRVTHEELWDSITKAQKEKFVSLVSARDESRADESAQSKPASSKGKGKAKAKMKQEGATKLDEDLLVIAQFQELRHQDEKKIRQSEYDLRPTTYEQMQQVTLDLSIVFCATYYKASITEVYTCVVTSLDLFRSNRHKFKTIYDSSGSGDGLHKTVIIDQEIVLCCPTKETASDISNELTARGIDSYLRTACTLLDESVGICCSTYTLFSNGILVQCFFSYSRDADGKIFVMLAPPTVTRNGRQVDPHAEELSFESVKHKLKCLEQHRDLGDKGLIDIHTNLLNAACPVYDVHLHCIASRLMRAESPPRNGAHNTVASSYRKLEDANGRVQELMNTLATFTLELAMSLLGYGVFSKNKYVFVNEGSEEHMKGHTFIAKVGGYDMYMSNTPAKLPRGLIQAVTFGCEIGDAPLRMRKLVVALGSRLHMSIDLKLVAGHVVTDHFIIFTTSRSLDATHKSEMLLTHDRAPFTAALSRAFFHFEDVSEFVSSIAWCLSAEMWSHQAQAALNRIKHMEPSGLYTVRMPAERPTAIAFAG